MQKAEPQHRQTQQQPAVRQMRGAAASPQGGHTAQLADMIHNSPLQAAQRKKFDSLFGTAQRVGEGEQGMQPHLKPRTQKVLQRVLNTGALTYTNIVNQYPNAGAASGQCHNAALALKNEAINQIQPWNYVWAFCEDPNNMVLGGMEDHVAVESGGTVYDPTLQQFPGVAGGMWTGTVMQWRAAVLRAFRTKFRSQQMNGGYTVSFDQSTTWHGNAWSAPGGLVVLGTFNVPAGGGCTIL